MDILISNLITICLLIGTIIILVLKTKANTPKSLSQYQLIFSFLLLTIGITGDTLYHLGFGKAFDTYGEYVTLLFFPLIILSIFTYSMDRENEKIRKINDELTKSNMELDSFVYRVSHDLRAPLCSAMGLTTISKESEDIKEIKHYLTLQETSLQRLDQFIRDILNYSKNNHSEIINEKIDFSQLIDTALQDYQSTDMEKIRVIKNLDSVIPFANDILRLRIIFNNLISNAIKFQKESEVNPFIEINVQTTPEQATISVRDNGIGIQDAFKEDVFKMFFRATSKSYGSGLGLYIVNDCVQKLNGSLELTSKYKEGTTIKITVPNRSNF